MKIAMPIFISLMLSTTAIVVLCATTAFPADAAEGRGSPSTTEGKPTGAGSAARAEGEVRKIDKAAGRITIKHGPMPQLDMPAMTMVYRVKDKTMLGPLQVGDKIRFDVDGAGGAFTVSRLEKVK